LLPLANLPIGKQGFQQGLYPLGRGARSSW
jgi:hypothetical protein